MSLRFRLPVLLASLLALGVSSCSERSARDEANLRLAGNGQNLLRRGPEGEFPRLLIEGLTVVSSDEELRPKDDDPTKRFHRFNAELSRDGVKLRINMYEDDAAGYDRLVQDRIGESDEQQGATVFGYPGTIRRHRGGGGYGALWYADGISYQVDFFSENREQFLDAVKALRVVAEDEWEAILPETSVKSGARSQEVDRMLLGIPPPPNFSVDALRRGPAIKRDSLGIEVSKVAACGWVEVWSAARQAGNAAEAKSAVDAMGTSRQWPVLREIYQTVPSWPTGVWSWADAMAGDGRLGVQTVEQRADLSCQFTG